MAVGALEPQFYAELLDGLGLDAHGGARPRRPRAVADLRALLRDGFAPAPATSGRTVFAGRDACVTPVLDLAEAPAHPHLVARATFTEVDGVRHPRRRRGSSARPASSRGAPCYAGEHTDEVLAELGLRRRPTSPSSTSAGAVAQLSDGRQTVGVGVAELAGGEAVVGR